MKKSLLLLLVPLTVQADPHFGPAFEREVLWYFIGLPLVVAQLVNWTFRLLTHKKTNGWFASIAALLMNWLGIYCVISGGIGSFSNGLFSLSGGLYLAAFSGAGTLLVSVLSQK